MWAPFGHQSRRSITRCQSVDMPKSIVFMRVCDFSCPVSYKCHSTIFYREQIWRPDPAFLGTRTHLYKPPHLITAARWRSGGGRNQHPNSFMAQTERARPARPILSDHVRRSPTPVSKSWSWCSRNGDRANPARSRRSFRNESTRSGLHSYRSNRSRRCTWGCNLQRNWRCSW